jgi:hypothetical protein
MKGQKMQNFDVIIIGGGTSGAIAAIAAARSGARTLVLEKNNILGGMLSAGMSLIGALDAEGHWALGGIGRQLIDSLIEKGYATPPTGSVAGAIAQDPEMLKLYLLRMARDAGVEILFHSFVVDVDAGDRQIRTVTVANKGGLTKYSARVFIDCSGDADVIANSGGEFKFGREGDNATQPVSNLFRVANVELDKCFEYMKQNPEEISLPTGWSGSADTLDYIRTTPGVHFSTFKKLITAAREAGDFHIDRTRVCVYTFPGHVDVVVNVTRVHGIRGSDPLDLSRAEMELQAQTLEVVQFLRKYVPGFERSYLVAMPAPAGIRESRHVVGHYTLVGADVLAGRNFDDQIGRGAYPLDIHDVSKDGGANASAKGAGISMTRVTQSYGVPFRCLIPVGLDNALVAGRCISADHEAAASARGQAVCMVTGHAAGTAAAMCVQNACSPQALDVAQLQETLAGQGAIIERPAQSVRDMPADISVAARHA